MATIEIPELQTTVALRKANEIRMGAARVKRDVKAGRLTIAEAVSDERAGVITAIDLLASQPFWGEKRAAKALGRTLVPGHRRVRELTERQRSVLAEACR